MQDPKFYPGTPPVYELFRGTPLGIELEAVLEQFRSLGMITEQQKDMMLDEFDRSMTQHLDEVQAGSMRIWEGNVVDMKKVDRSYQITLQPGVIHFDDHTYTSESLEIIAVNGNVKPK